MKVIVTTTFEGGYQPLNAICAATAIKDAGFDVSLVDVYVEGLHEANLYYADVICISIPLFDSLSTGVQLAENIEKWNPKSKIVFFGQYAAINASSLTGKYSHYTIVGEWEIPFVNLVKYLNGFETDLLGVVDIAKARSNEAIIPYLNRSDFTLPDRSLPRPQF